MYKPPSDTEFFSDYFKTQIGEYYYFKKNGDDWLVFNFQDWVPVTPPDAWILNHIKPMSEFTETFDCLE